MSEGGEARDQGQADPLDWRVPYPDGLPPSLPGRSSPSPKDPEMPSAVWLCPVHADEFWVPHGGVCPAMGCTAELVRYDRGGTR